MTDPRTAWRKIILHRISILTTLLLISRLLLIIRRLIVISWTIGFLVDLIASTTLISDREPIRVTNRD